MYNEIGKRREVGMRGGEVGIRERERGKGGSKGQREKKGWNGGGRGDTMVYVSVSDMTACCSTPDRMVLFTIWSSYYILYL